MFSRNKGNVSRTFVSILRWVSLGFIFLAVLLTVWQLVRFSRMRNTFPSGLDIAGVPVGGLDQQKAAERLMQAYGVQVELRYEGAVIQVKPAVLGFELDLPSMLAAADIQRLSQPFWDAFWNYLWGRVPKPTEIPLRANISEERMRVFLENEIATRYDRDPEAAKPVPGSVNFNPGTPGSSLDIERAVVLISDALRSPGSRVVNLTYNRTTPPRPSIQNLQIMLQQVIDQSGFKGETEIYLFDLQTNEELDFAYKEGANLPTGIAFTAASTMKIPIMVSVFKRVGEPTPQAIQENLQLMIERSENDPADRLMEQTMDRTLGPLQVTDDLMALGYKNTFLAGYFYPGAALLKKIETPANMRIDVNTGPDPYNQTTPAEMGMLMEDVYQCATSGGGAFAAVFPGQITQSECKTMLEHLTLNRIGVLIQAGLPDGTQSAHKHGWITEGDGLIHTIGDTALVYTPGGNFILSIFMHDPNQLVWDPANLLFAQLTSAVYNYFNQE